MLLSRDAILRRRNQKWLIRSVKIASCAVLAQRAALLALSQKETASTRSIPMHVLIAALVQRIALLALLSRLDRLLNNQTNDLKTN